jgi:hypothetical protein
MLGLLAGYETGKLALLNLNTCDHLASLLPWVLFRFLGYWVLINCVDGKTAKLSPMRYLHLGQSPSGPRVLLLSSVPARSATSMDSLALGITTSENGRTNYSEILHTIQCGDQILFHLGKWLCNSLYHYDGNFPKKLVWTSNMAHLH